MIKDVHNLLCALIDEFGSDVIAERMQNDWNGLTPHNITDTVMEHLESLDDYDVDDVCETITSELLSIANNLGYRVVTTIDYSFEPYGEN